MNFLELINKCLLELNYRQVNTMAELVNNDHRKIVDIMNVINREVCSVEGWNFLLRRMSINLPAKTSEIDNDVNGRILYVFIDGQKYEFCEDIERFMLNNPSPKTYSSFDKKLMFPMFSEDKSIDVIYYTNNCALNEDGNEITNMENATDCSLIPMPFVEQLLVYGTCLRLKANPQYFKFSYWISMYKEALLNLRSKSSTAVLNTPIINIFRS